jgi:hypothetical protein
LHLNSDIYYGPEGERERVTQVLYFLGNQFSGEDLAKKVSYGRKTNIHFYNLIYGL